MYRSVVVVDDSDIEGQITKHILQKQSFAENISTFNSAMAALVYLNNTKVFPDVIFLDINMPIMDGFDFLDSYVKFPAEKKQGCMVVILSGSDSPKDLIKAQEHPAVKAILRKPLPLDKLEDFQK
jgi:CheY-like chemotaxis protein